MCVKKVSPMIERGRKFERLAGQHMKEHKGIAFTSGCRPSKSMFVIVFATLEIVVLKCHTDNVEGRVMVDCKTSTRLEANTAFEMKFIDDYNDTAIRPIKRRRTHDLHDENESQVTVAEHRPKLADDQRLLANAAVHGFCFSSKVILEFFVDNLHDVEWNDMCFDQLVLAPSQKDLIQALVANHITQGKQGFDDLVKGKGQGLVLVLHGPPGVGKTLTAPSVWRSTLADRCTLSLRVISALMPKLSTLACHGSWTWLPLGRPFC